MTIRMESYLLQAKVQQEKTKKYIQFELRRMIQDNVPQIKEFDISPFRISYGRDLLRYQIYKVINECDRQSRDQIASLFEIHKYGDKFLVSFRGENK